MAPGDVGILVPEVGVDVAEARLVVGDDGVQPGDLVGLDGGEDEMAYPGLDGGGDILAVGRVSPTCVMRTGCMVATPT